VFDIRDQSARLRQAGKKRIVQNSLPESPNAPAENYAALQYKFTLGQICWMFCLNGEARKGDYAMRYLHSMMRVANLEMALDFFCAKLGWREVRRMENEKGRFTLVFLAAPGDRGRATSEGAPLVELTYNWDPEVYAGGRNFGHLAYAVDDIYATCEKLMAAGVVINRPPRDGRMAFVRTPDGISIELLQEGAAMMPKEPWASMPNTGSW
jgi:lactoylglutathione lyase